MHRVRSDLCLAKNICTKHTRTKPERRPAHPSARSSSTEKSHIGPKGSVAHLSLSFSPPFTARYTTRLRRNVIVEKKTARQGRKITDTNKNSTQPGEWFSVCFMVIGNAL